jgi:cyclic beta-1,2-glucan synthetase
VLKLRNESGRPRKLSATGYVEWVLGDLRARSAMHVSTEVDPESGALLARNPYNTEFAGRVAFFDVDEPKRSVSGDRTEFLGRNGTPGNPAALRRVRLSGKVGAGLDPCAAIQVGIDLADGQQREIVFRLGVGRNAGRSPRPGAALSRQLCGARRARGRVATVEPHLGRGAGGNTRSVGRCAGQRLVAIPDACLPHLGAHRLLPVGRRLRLP